MKKQFIIASAMSLVATAAAAQAPTGQKAQAAPQNIARATIQAELKAAFERADTNKDGSLSVAEADAAQEKVAAQTAAALAARAEAEFARIDTDKNGQISLAEFKAAIGRPRVLSGADIVKAVDTNKDGKVSLAEFEAQGLAQFDRLDADHDGIIEPNERKPKR